MPIEFEAAYIPESERILAIPLSQRHGDEAAGHRVGIRATWAAAVLVLESDQSITFPASADMPEVEALSVGALMVTITVPAGMLPPDYEVSVSYDLETQESSPPSWTQSKQSGSKHYTLRAEPLDVQFPPIEIDHGGLPEKGIMHVTLTGR